MQLCDRWESSKYGAAQCYELYGGCQGAIGNNCWPNWVWAGTKASVAGKAYDRALESGGWIINEYTPHEFTNAFSVRCVLDLGSGYYKLRVSQPSRYGQLSSATTVQVLHTVLHSAEAGMAAARVLLKAIVRLIAVTPMFYGQASR